MRLEIEKKKNLTSLPSTCVKTQMASKSSKKMGNSRPFRNYLTRFDLIPSIITFSREKKEKEIRRDGNWDMRYKWAKVSLSFFLRIYSGRTNLILSLWSWKYHSVHASDQGRHIRDFFHVNRNDEGPSAYHKFIDRIVADSLAYSAVFCLVLDRLQITTDCQPLFNFWSALSILFKVSKSIDRKSF